MHPGESLFQETQSMVGTGIVGLRGGGDVYSKPHAGSPMPMSFDMSTYSRILQQMTKLYPYDPAAVAASISALGQASHLPMSFTTGTPVISHTPPAEVPSALQSLPRNTPLKIDTTSQKMNLNLKSEVKLKAENTTVPDKALDLSTQGLKSLYSHYKRISMKEIKPKIVEDLWVENDHSLSWTDSKVAAYNPAQKIFMCADCECVGFLSRVAEHWLGSHANLRVFHCPRCPYTSAWSRCVKMHLTRQHNEQFADTTMWKENETLLEVTKLMQDLRTKVETKIDANNTLADKRFYCPHCPYATDRRDLYTRHENIHKDNKPFHCYVCFKQFNRADHVKKHFVRMHTDYEYDISKIRKQPNAKNNNSSNSDSSKNNQNLNKKIAFPSVIEPKIIKKDVSPDFKLSVPITSNLPESVSEISVLEVKPSNIMEKTTDASTRGRRKGDKAYTCHYCNWSGSDNWCLKRHMNTHIKPFACIMCDYKAARAERLSTHVWKVHNKRICNKCNYLADTQERLLEHTREEHHNNPYSRRHICASCGMSFDTRANLETHIHLTHTRPKSPKDIVRITPIPMLPESVQEMAQDLSMKRRYSGEEALCLICPVEQCSKPCETSGILANHVRSEHGGLFASRCPHCSYNLTQDELAKDHWLTHHDEVCSACVHVFTSVYGPQLWKKVLANTQSPGGNPLDSIVSDLNKKRVEPVSADIVNGLIVQNYSYSAQSSCSIGSPSPPSSPGSESQDTEERYNKRKRKQSCPKKVITLGLDTSKSQEEPPMKVIKVTNKKFFIKKCLKCPNRPQFSSFARLLEHKRLRHNNKLKRKLKRLRK